MPSSSVHQWAYDLGKRLIDKHGRYVELEWDVPVETQGAIPGDLSTVPESKTIVGVQTAFTDTERTIWTVSGNDIAMLLDGEVEPKIGMRIVDSANDSTCCSSQSYLRIENVLTIKSGTLAVLYKVQATA